MRFKDIEPGMTIRCQSVAERLFLLEQLEKLGYVWQHSGAKPTESLPLNPKALYVMTEKEKKLTYSCFGTQAIDFSCLSIGVDTDIAYARGLNDAWELIKKLCLSEKDGGLDVDTYIECFGTGMSLGNILKKYTCEDVLNIIKEQENKLKVGDIVEIDGRMAVVVALDSDKESIHVVYADGVFEICKKDNSNIKKRNARLDIAGAIVSEWLGQKNENY